jgi:hypothetical protein
MHCEMHTSNCIRLMFPRTPYCTFAKKTNFFQSEIILEWLKDKRAAKAMTISDVIF